MYALPVLSFSSVYGSVFTIRVAERFVEGGRISDVYTPKIKASPLTCKISAIACLLYLEYDDCVRIYQLRTVTADFL